jgi:hypothetical protein
MSGTKSAVFILAGCSGVGKTTLLRRAYHYGIPVFGEPSKDLFLATNPERISEQQVFEAALPTRLFQAKHVPLLLDFPQRPEFFLVHLDLLNLLMFLIADSAIQDKMPPRLRQEETRSADDLLDKKKNKEIYLAYLRIAFPYADSLIVNTLYIAFHRNAEQWNQRAEVLRRTHPDVDVDSFRFMFDPRYPRPDIHRAIHEPWFDALEEFKCERAYICKGKKGMLEVEQTLPSRGGINTYPFAPLSKP